MILLVYYGELCKQVRNNDFHYSIKAMCQYPFLASIVLNVLPLSTLKKYTISDRNGEPF